MVGQRNLMNGNMVITNGPNGEQLLDLATTVARQSQMLSQPNPHVGCVLSDASGKLLGQGHTQAVGGAHAEIMAIQDALRRGFDLTGATAYVTLEPCSHHGRTGPCCDALIAAGITQVIATNTDPNPLVAGHGFAKLRAAGVQVTLLEATHPLAIKARELNIGFFSRMIRKSPWVRMKVAASLDGKTALLNGQSQWITSVEARTDGHAWRARAGAILTGIGTVLQDQPRLDVRLIDSPRQPHLVIVDSKLETPLQAPLWEPVRKVLIYCAINDVEKTAALARQGATVIHLPGRHPNGTLTEKVDLAALLADLGRREVNELHVEAGFKLNGSLVREHLVDEFLVYLAPKLVGQGGGMAEFGPLTTLAEALPLQFQSVERIGPDLRIVARVRGREGFEPPS